MQNEFYFQIPVSQEQIDYAQGLVEYSLKHHAIPNIWDSKEDKKALTKTYRLIGSLGEVVFADVYDLKRKEKSYGAADGQDLGKDFQMYLDNKIQNIDIKAMQRKTSVFYRNYVLNIPASQLHKANSLTNIYYCISFHQKDSQWFASLLGFISKAEILAGKTGILYKAGAERIRANKTSFFFNEDTYEIDFQDFHTPIINDKIKSIQGFSLKNLK